MKRLIILIIIFQSEFLFSQNKETVITDTSLVKWYFDETNDDTVFYLKDYLPLEKWTVYYDINKKQKAFETETIYHKPSLEYREKRISWYRDGGIKSKEYFDGDTAIWLKYYQNDQVKRIYKELWGIPEYYEIPQRTWIVFSELNYYQNGQLKQTPIDRKSKGHCTRVQPITVYFENGKPNFQLNWLCMALVGEFREYYENGKLKTAGAYTTDVNKDPTKPLQNGGIEDGEWKYYNIKGKLIKTEVYNKGKLVRTIEK